MTSMTKCRDAGQYLMLSDRGVPAIRRALSEADIVVLDELGRFELEVPEFTDAVKDALDALLVVGVLKDESNWFLDGVRERTDTRNQVGGKYARGRSTSYSGSVAAALGCRSAAGGGWA